MGVAGYPDSEGRRLFLASAGAGLSFRHDLPIESIIKKFSHRFFPGNLETPSLSHLPMRIAFHKTLLAAVLAGAGFAAGAQGDRVNLPDMGGSADSIFAPGEEERYAAEFERYLRAQNLLVEDPLIDSYFADMGYKLASRSNRAGRPFRFLVIRANDINAFASPGGLIGMNAGLILAADSENEVAGVFAHEIAHVTQNHLARGYENQQQVSLPIMLASLGLALAAGMAGAGGDAVSAAAMIGQGLATQSMINYTRQMESEADRVGINLLSRAGYDPEGMADFFTKLTRLSRAYGQGPPEYLRTHPLSTTRTAEARNRLERLPSSRHEESLEFHLMQARLRVMMESRPERAIEYFRTRIESDEGPFDEAHRYGLALAQIRGGRLDRDGSGAPGANANQAELRILGTEALMSARETIDELLSNKPEFPLYQQLQAEWHLAGGEIDQALDVLGRLYHNFEGNQAIAMQYSDALLYKDDPERAERAVSVLRRTMRERAPNAMLYEHLAKALDRTGESVASAEAVAEAYYLRDNLPGAIDQLRRLQRRDDLSYYQRARVSARLSEWQVEMVEWERRRRVR